MGRTGTYVCINSFIQYSKSSIQISAKKNTVRLDISTKVHVQKVVL